MGSEYAQKYARGRKEEKELAKAFVDDSVSEDEDALCDQCGGGSDD